MRKIIQQKRWTVFIIFALIILIGGFLYLYFTGQLNLLLELKLHEIEKFFLGSLFGVILLGWITALLYGYVFPNPDKQLLAGQKIINKEVGGNSNKLDEIQKRLEEMAIKQNRPIEDLLRENKELKEKLQKESIINISRELQTEIDQLFSEFKYFEARSSIDKFLQEHENIKQKDLAKLHYQKSLIYEAEINYPKAKEEIETAIALERNNYKIDSQYGNILHVLGNYDKAINYYEKALGIQLNKFGEDHPSVATSYNNLGFSCHTKGNYDKAIEYNEKALRIQLNKFGEDHPDIATSYNNLAYTWNRKGIYDKAIEYNEKALKIKLKKLGEDHPNVAISYNDLAYTWNRKGNYDKAINYYEKALGIKLKKLGEDHPGVATSYNNLGLFWKRKGNYDKAIEYNEKALKIQLNKFDKNHPDIATSYNNLGGIWNHKGNCDKAIEYYEKALDILHKTFQNGHPQIDIIKESLKNAKRAQNS